MSPTQPARTVQMDVHAYMQEVGRNARSAARAVAAGGSRVKSAALRGIADSLDESRAELVSANLRDLDSARAAGLDQPLIDRLVLDTPANDRMIDRVRQVDSLPDPVGAISDLTFQPNGLQV